MGELQSRHQCEGTGEAGYGTQIFGADCCYDRGVGAFWLWREEVGKLGDGHDREHNDYNSCSHHDYNDGAGYYDHDSAGSGNWVLRLPDLFWDSRTREVHWR